MLFSFLMKRREYALRLTINGRNLNKVVIDTHYEEKHSKTVNDPLILELIRGLNGRMYPFEKVTDAGWEIYVNDPLYLGQKPYRLIWCLHPDENYIGIINAFRRSHGKLSK
jgi:hypothetical protein